MNGENEIARVDGRRAITAILLITKCFNCVFTNDKRGKASLT